jgi:hypothetical protein
LYGAFKVKRLFQAFFLVVEVSWFDLEARFFIPTHNAKSYRAQRLSSWQSR